MYFFTVLTTILFAKKFNETLFTLELLDTKPWDEDFKRIVKVLLYTGMRSGECLGLIKRRAAAE